LVRSAHLYGINVPKKIAARNFPLRQFGPSHVRDWFMLVGARGAASPPSSALPGAREKIGVSQKFTSAVRWGHCNDVTWGKFSANAFVPRRMVSSFLIA
jgi:hypothetical protein